MVVFMKNMGEPLGVKLPMFLFAIPIFIFFIFFIFIFRQVEMGFFFFD